jgi:hypothetical protein
MRLAEPLDQVSEKGNASARQNPDLRQSPGLPPDLGVPLQPAVPCPRGSPIAQARFGRLPRAPSPTAHCRLLTTLYFRYGADSALPLPGSFFSELASLTAELWLRGDQLAPSVTSNELTVHAYFDSNLSGTIRRKCVPPPVSHVSWLSRKLAKLDGGGALAGSRGG